jgi:NADH dehydrogenase FAD-containing subunit
VAAIEVDGVCLADGTVLPGEVIVTAAGAGGGHLFADAGLAVDARGFLLVDDSLRGAEQPAIFAAGDCATLVARPGLPKAGVHAVRQGPVLAANLRAALRGDPLRRYRPQRRALALLNTADGRAVLSYGAVAAQGRWVWRLKDAIDRRFVHRFDR